MAFGGEVVTHVNADGAHLIFRLKENLKAQGWTVPRSSDGTTYNAAGDQITHKDDGANGMDNSLAWFCIRQMPGLSGHYAGTREWVFQRNTSGADTATGWYVGYSVSGYGAGGTATQMPTFPSDHQVLIGSGTPASPGFENLFSFSSTEFASSLVCVGDAEENGSWFWTFKPNSAAKANEFQRELSFDALRSVADTTDPEPYIIGRHTSTASFDAGTMDSKYFSWYDYGGGGAAFQQVVTSKDTTNGFPGCIPTQAIRRNSFVGPILFYRGIFSAAPIGFKGYSTLYHWAGLHRWAGQTFNARSGKRFIALSQDVMASWNSVKHLF